MHRGVVAFGSLIQNTEPREIDLSKRTSFLGLGFGYGSVPIDMIGLFLAGLETKEYSILLVDEFQRFNNVPEEHIALGLVQTKRALNGLSRLYNHNPAIILSSDFMQSGDYSKVLREAEERIADQKLTAKVLQTVPEKFRSNPNATKYTTNEIACVQFLRKKLGIEAKIGPSKEAAYDGIMRELGMKVDFAYVIDAYALGTGEPEKVTHYVPEHRGSNNGQRLFLDEPLHKSEQKLLLGPEEALRYLLRVASASGFRLGRTYLSEDEIQDLQGRKLKKAAKTLVLENILMPYREAAKNE
ncbi:hypothetical protein HYV80_02005 [Candidatus Woesearchaeota archaeon]|nr:hypothetical protein [Candidatus Woesearchaeota archaeon]